MRRFLPLFLVFSLLVSCSQSDFKVSGAGFDNSGNNLRIKAYLEEGDEDEKYSFILTSPDKDLVWKGDLILDRGGLLSEELLITPGAEMPEGEYSLILHSTNGTDVTKTITL